VECASALARLERAVLLDVKGAALAFDRLKQLADGWREIEPGEIVSENALRFPCVHPLRAADALQLARLSLPPNDVPRRFRWSRSTSVSRKEGFELIDVIRD
jgi:hypothetical protein